MESLATQLLQSISKLVGDPFMNAKTAAIGMVANYRIFDARHMHTYLMCASGFKF